MRYLFTGLSDDATPESESYPGCHEAYKDDPECDDNHPRHWPGKVLRGDDTARLKMNTNRGSDRT
jgi:hypothetical protein